MRHRFELAAFTHYLDQQPQLNIVAVSFQDSDAYPHGERHSVGVPCTRSGNIVYGPCRGTSGRSGTRARSTR